MIDSPRLDGATVTYLRPDPYEPRGRRSRDPAGAGWRECAVSRSAGGSQAGPVPARRVGRGRGGARAGPRVEEQPATLRAADLLEPLDPVDASRLREGA